MAKDSAIPSLPSILRRAKSKRTVITFHSLADLDAVGAAIALRRHIQGAAPPVSPNAPHSRIGKKALICPPDKPAASARKLLEYTGEKTTPFASAGVSEKDFLIVLDSSSPRMLPQLAGLKPDLMIDHHTHFGGEITAKRAINDPTASSTCEIIYFLLKPKDKLVSIALLLGIISDSAGFQSATSRTFLAVSALLQTSGISYSKLKSLAFAPEAFSERLEALRSCQSVSAERIGENIIAIAMAKSHEAHFADLLVRMGADIAFVGCKGEDGRISSRMREHLRGRVRLDRIMHEAGKVLGGNGGGHELAAGATGSKESVRECLSVCKKLAEQQILSTESNKIKKIEW